MPTARRFARAIMAGLGLARILAGLTGAGPGTAARAATVSLWHFDEAPTVAPGAALADSGPAAHHLLLGRRARLVSGQFGRALQPADSTPAAPGRTEDPTLGAPGVSPHFANVTDSGLNVGSGDWTLEAWLFLPRSAAAEGVILELGASAAPTNELVTRFSVLPRENAFLLTGLSPLPAAATAIVARQVEFANPEGPPTGRAAVFTATLALRFPLPRERWFHAALVHRETEVLQLFVDGRLAATASGEMIAVPRSAEGYLAVGGDRHGRRSFAGAIDELQISDHAVYLRDFTPSPGFIPPPR